MRIVCRMTTSTGRVLGTLGRSGASTGFRSLSPSDQLHLLLASLTFRDPDSDPLARKNGASTDSSTGFRWSEPGKESVMKDCVAVQPERQDGTRTGLGVTCSKISMKSPS